MATCTNKCGREGVTETITDENGEETTFPFMCVQCEEEYDKYVERTFPDTCVGCEDLSLLWVNHTCRGE
jgi:hypothetical protein